MQVVVYFILLAQLRLPRSLSLVLILQKSSSKNLQRFTAVFGGGHSFDCLNLRHVRARSLLQLTVCLHYLRLHSSQR